MNGRSHTLNVENFRDMLHICPRLFGQRFEDPPLEEEILSYIRDLGHAGEIKCARDDSMFNTIRVISRHQDTQVYGAILHVALTYQEMLDSKAYKEYYAIASGAEPPKAKTKYKKKANESVTSPKSKTAFASKGTKLKSKANMDKPDKKKQPAKKTKAKGLAVLSEVALTEAKQIKLVTKRSKIDFHISQASGSDSEDEDDNDDDGDNDDDAESDHHDDKSNDERTESDIDEIYDPNLTNVDQTEYEEEEVDEEKLNDEETMDDEEDDEVFKELYEDVNVNQEKGDAEMTDANQIVSDAQKVDEPIQSSSVSSDFTSKFLNHENPSLADNKIASLMETLAPHATIIPKITSGFTTNTPPPPPFFNPPLQQQTPTIATPTFTTTISTNPTVTLPEIPNFASVFKFDQRVSTLEFELSELKSTNQFAKVVSLILGIVDKYLDSKMKEAVNVVVQLQTNKLREEAHAKNQDFLNHVDSIMKKIIKDQVKEQVSKMMPKIKKYVIETLRAEALVRTTNQPQTAYAVAASLSEFKLKKILIDKMEANKSINRPDTQKNLYNALVESYNSDKDIITSYGDVVLLKRGRDDQDKDEDPSAGSD
nr:hypothetical protein [Tanacetum cinerariifolium]